MTEIRKGTIDDFFASALNTASEIDKGKKITPKKIIWVEIEDFGKLLKPSRIELIRYLREKKKVYFSVLIKELRKSPSSANRDLELLEKYGLVNISMEVHHGHGKRKIIFSLLDDESFEIRAAI